MKQKYIITKEKDLLVIKEYAELDKDLMSLLCEETYTQEDIREAMAVDTEELIQILRTHNLYPPSIYVTRLAETIIEMMNDDGMETQELKFDDKEMFLKDIKLEPETKEADETTTAVDVESQDIAVDELLEDTLEEEIEEKKVIKDLKSSIKIADDDSAGGDIA